MIYRSNLLAPDLRPYFKLRKPSKLIMGHDAPSDPDFEPDCTFLTDDEAAILYHCAKAFPKRWVDIGARFGWSTAHIVAALPEEVHAVDPHFAVLSPYGRFCDNLADAGDWPVPVRPFPWTSELYFAVERSIDAAMIDGNHDEPEPTNDAYRAVCAGAKVLVFHDFQGRPIRDAVNWVLCGTDSWLAPGWRARVYWTPNLMAVAWREDSGFVPPEHVRDPAIDWSGCERIVAEDFDCGRCS